MKKDGMRCGFCGALIDEGGKYIYPVPKQELIVNIRYASDGLMACSDCAPEQEALQIEQGLVVPIYKVKE